MGANPSISYLHSQDATRAKLEAAGFRVLVWQDTTEAALASAVARAGSAVGPPPVFRVPGKICAKEYLCSRVLLTTQAANRSPR
jgi:hypothetical protein